MNPPKHVAATPVAAGIFRNVTGIVRPCLPRAVQSRGVMQQAHAPHMPGARPLPRHCIGEKPMGMAMAEVICGISQSGPPSGGHLPSATDCARAAPRASSEA